MGSGPDIPTSPSPSPGAVGPVATAPLSDDDAQFASPAGVSALIAADLMPVVGVLFLGWQVFPIVLLYWLENVVVGVITVLKMAYAQGSPDPVVEGGDPAALAGEKPRRAIVVFPSTTRFDSTE